VPAHVGPRLALHRADRLLACAVHFPDAYYGQNTSASALLEPAACAGVAPRTPLTPMRRRFPLQICRDPRDPQQPHPQGVLRHATPTALHATLLTESACSPLVAIVLQAPQEWHTQVALPFVKIVGTSVEWDVSLQLPIFPNPPFHSRRVHCLSTHPFARQEIKFDVRLLQRVPVRSCHRRVHCHAPLTPPRPPLCVRSMKARQLPLHPSASNVQCLLPLLVDGCAVRHLAHEHFAAPPPPRSRRSPRNRFDHRVRFLRVSLPATIACFVPLAELDFCAHLRRTEAGRSHFADQLKSIRYCVQETCNFDVIFAVCDHA